MVEESTTAAAELRWGEAAWLGAFGVVGGFLLAGSIGLIVLTLAFSGFDEAAAVEGQSDPAVLLTGERVYASECARCHGTSGQGGAGLPLGGGIVVERYPDIADQIAVITEGRRVMPSFGEELTEAEIDAVARYERERLGR